MFKGIKPKPVVVGMLVAVALQLGAMSRILGSLSQGANQFR